MAHQISRVDRKGLLKPFSPLYNNPNLEIDIETIFIGMPAVIPTSNIKWEFT